MRLSYLHRIRRAVVEPLRGPLRLLPFALPAAALVGLGLLAEARQELAVSPYGARAVLDDIRGAWDLDPVSAQGSQLAVVIPPPWGTTCTWHPRP
ncbi:hypothetical protein ABT063_08945 [Streptomyces sp. NPDC002838]|uniref:hypothetical protein n=1 Tax=Streptomyces sp. NPDC002838 TaxID=3154436 RepID=UPI00331B3A34